VWSAIIRTLKRKRREVSADKVEKGNLLYTEAQRKESWGVVQSEEELYEGDRQDLFKACSSENLPKRGSGKGVERKGGNMGRLGYQRSSYRRKIIGYDGGRSSSSVAWDGKNKRILSERPRAKGGAERI